MDILNNHITWDEYFMGIAQLSSLRSKDPTTKVGACIVSQDNRVLSLGYNGMPRGCDDSIMPWGRDDENPLNNKYPYVVHAELNAILNANKDIRGSKLYVTLFPCNECAKAIIQSGIVEVIFLADTHRNEFAGKASDKLLSIAGIKITAYKGRVPSIKY